MELYVEREFLDYFFIDFEDRKYQKIVKNIFTAYGDRKVYIDYNIDDFFLLKDDNIFFSLMGNILPPIPISNIKNALSETSNFDLTIVFVQKEEEWLSEIREKGALCFSFDNYESQIAEIIEKLHFRIDLSNGFKGWDFLELFNVISFNELMITDGYILSGKDEAMVKQNIIPILKALLKEHKRHIDINILTKELTPISDQPKHVKEKAKRRYKLLNRIFANYEAKFKIILDSYHNPYDFHDRIIQTNFSLTECGKGFNLSKSKKSNSSIFSETIFDKYTYDRLRNHKRMQTEYFNKLNKLETLKFKSYP